MLLIIWSIFGYSCPYLAVGTLSDTEQDCCVTACCLKASVNTDCNRRTSAACAVFLFFACVRSVYRYGTHGGAKLNMAI